uniref:SGNH hydrolase-type esterase domain-containing protein n=1 Tax=Podarcis muralis TaxID=64176 RepID=A0A670I570_PODMU
MEQKCKKQKSLNGAVLPSSKPASSSYGAVQVILQKERAQKSESAQAGRRVHWPQALAGPLELLLESAASDFLHICQNGSQLSEGVGQIYTNIAHFSGHDGPKQHSACTTCATIDSVPPQSVSCMLVCNIPRERRLHPSFLKHIREPAGSGHLLFIKFVYCPSSEVGGPGFALIVFLEIRNRFEVLSPSMEDEEQTPFEDLSLITVDQVYEDEEQRQSSGNVQATLEPTAHRRTPTRPKRRRVVVIGDSLLRGTEAVICGPDKMSREVCCLPGAKIQDVTERLQGIIKPTDKYPFLLVHVGTNDTASNSLQKIKRDYEALGRKLKQLNAQIVISSVLPVERRGPGREGKIVEVNNWLRKWCKQERFGFLDHGMQFLEDGLLASDGLHLTTVGRNVFAKNLRNLIRRALN